MKKLFLILLVLAFCTLAACSKAAEPVSPDPTPTLEPEKTVVFSDPLLEKMVRAAMNKPEGEITFAEAEAVTVLDLGIDWQQDPVPNSQIKDISGLENFINLENLDLQFHAITDISPLAGLNKLNGLSLGGNPIADITPLAGLTNLGFLTLFGCQAQDYTPLENLTGLGTLFLEYSTIRDVSMLSGLTELSRLSLAHTQVSDVSPLSALTNIKNLMLAECPISDYTPLSAIYENLDEKDFSIVTSLRELGFSATDNTPQVESYKTEDMYVLVNRAEWGEMENKDQVNMVLLCRNHGTDNEITVIYYPNENQYLVLKQSPQDFRYIHDVEGSGEMDIEYGDHKEIETFIEKTYDEVDPYIMLTPIKDFQRTMTNTFGVSANTLFALPRETEAIQPTKEPAASENSLIGMGFDFDYAKVFGVYEEHEPHYSSIAIHRPEWGEFNDWDIELSDTDVNGYVLMMWYNAADGKWHVSLENKGASYEYYPEGKFEGCSPDPDTVRRLFNDALGTQGDGFYEASLAHFDKYAQDRFNMSINELYMVPKE